MNTKTTRSEYWTLSKTMANGGRLRANIAGVNKLVTNYFIGCKLIKNEPLKEDIIIYGIETTRTTRRTSNIQ